MTTGAAGAGSSLGNSQHVFRDCDKNQHRYHDGPSLCFLFSVLASDTSHSNAPEVLAHLYFSSVHVTRGFPSH